MILKIGFYICLTFTVASLIFGFVCLFKGGDFNKKYGNVAMRARILLQAITLILLYLVFA